MQVSHCVVLTASNIEKKSAFIIELQFIVTSEYLVKWNSSEKWIQKELWFFNEDFKLHKPFAIWTIPKYIRALSV